MNDSWFNQEIFATEREKFGVTWGRPVRALDEAGSTNDLALDAIRSDARTGIVWVARSQSEGRGRRGNRWVAPPGEALLASVMIRWPGPSTSTAGLTLVSGLAVRSVVESRTGKPVHLKWPNDVLADGKKISGILVETRKSEDGTLGVVVGVGLNLLTEEFPSDLGPATSLKALGAPSEAIESILAELLGQLEQRISLLFREGIDRAVDEARAHDALVRRYLRIEEARVLGASGSTSVQGVCQGLSNEGHLLLELADGSTVAVESGHVQARLRD